MVRSQLICFRKVPSLSIGNADTALPSGLLKDWSTSMRGVEITPYTATSNRRIYCRIADLGLSKIVGRDVSCIITTMRGTRGYLTPEWITGGAITSKVDIFSYGKLLFEIISGKRNIEELKSDVRDYLPLQVASSIAKRGEVFSLMDRRLNGLVEMEEVCRACKVACWCIQDSERDRPTTSQVVQILEGGYGGRKTLQSQELCCNF